MSSWIKVSILHCVFQRLQFQKADTFSAKVSPVIFDLKILLKHEHQLLSNNHLLNRKQTFKFYCTTILKLCNKYISHYLYHYSVHDSGYIYLYLFLPTTSFWNTFASLDFYRFLFLLEIFWCNPDQTFSGYDC